MEIFSSFRAFLLFNELGKSIFKFWISNIKRKGEKYKNFAQMKYKLTIELNLLIFKWKHLSLFTSFVIDFVHIFISFLELNKKNTILQDSVLHDN